MDPLRDREKRAISCPTARALSVRWSDAPRFGAGAPGSRRALAARLLAQPLRPSASLGASLALFAIVATGACLLVSRLVFVLALKSYRSASS